jgi:hypothetical protein
MAPRRRRRDLQRRDNIRNEALRFARDAHAAQLRGEVAAALAQQSNEAQHEQSRQQLRGGKRVQRGVCIVAHEAPPQHCEQRALAHNVRGRRRARLRRRARHANCGRYNRRRQAAGVDQERKSIQHAHLAGSRAPTSNARAHKRVK